MNNKILCVDDEPNILFGYQRALRRDFDIHIAESGAQGLALIEAEGPFSVVVSDMRMPVMDGIRFLSQVKEIAPETVRIMLTGNSDQLTAMSAVNEGSIFRFLTKPCPPENFAKALDAGLRQYGLVTAEKQLLEDTLNHSLQVLVDILAFVNPTAFNRSARVKKLAREVAANLKVESLWEIEIAAILSQIGCVSVPEEILQKIANGVQISDKEANLYYQHPMIARDLIARIPRMEVVAEIVANQNRRFNDNTGVPTLSEKNEMVRTGARILKAVLDFDKLVVSGETPRAAVRELVERAGWYDPLVLSSLNKFVVEKAEEYVSIRTSIRELEPGMILDEPLMSTHGSLLLSPGQEITLSLMLRLKNFFEAGIIEDSLQVKAPVNKSQNKTAFSL